MKTRLILIVGLVILLGLGVARVVKPINADSPGQNGTVKIHDDNTESENLVDNDPKVCTFHLHFFFGDNVQQGSWIIKTQPGGVNTGLSDNYDATSGEDRAPEIGTFSLPDGQYKLYWDDVSTPEKQKVFKVECVTPTPTVTPTSTPTPTPTTEPTPTPTPTLEPTPTPTPTQEPTPTPTGEPTPTPTNAPEPTSTPGPEVTPTEGPTPTQSPEVTPTPGQNLSTSDFAVTGPSCTTNDFTAKMTLKNDKGELLKNINVRFQYEDQVFNVVTNDEGSATANFTYTKNGDVKAEASGFDTQSRGINKPTDCGSVLGTSTAVGGAVLGYASTGTPYDILGLYTAGLTMITGSGLAYARSKKQK